MPHVAIKILVALFMISHELIGVDSVTCFSCTKILNPSDCLQLKKCEPHEQCLIKKYISDSGNTWYDVGCLNSTECPGSSAGVSHNTEGIIHEVVGRRNDVTMTSHKKSLNPISVNDRQVDTSDTVTCTQCCNNDFCNREGDCETKKTVCYHCNYLPHQRDCDVIEECDSHEVCYGEMLLTGDGITYYKSGCKAKSVCTQSTVGLHNSNGILTPCSKCCNTSYCNRELCDKPIPNTGVRCLFCRDALSPETCFTSVQCSQGEVCYAQTFIHNQEKRYRLGCIPQQQCGPQSTSGPTSVENDYCGQCCLGENCNREVCSGSQSPSLHLLQPPLLTVCRDNSTSECQQNIQRCTEDYYRLYQCPYTCGFCTGHLVDIDECSSSPCLHRGRCHDGLINFTCTCRDGFTGHRCETNIDECTSSPCLHGARCHDQINSFTCQCRPGFNGTYCETDIDECNSSPCSDGATCHDGINSFTCTCSDGFTGDRCETKINDCSGPRTFSIGDHCYYLTDELTDWKVHHVDPCQNRNMTMAVIHSNLEHDEIIHNVRGIMHETRTFWLGGYYDPRHHSHWYWIDGSQIGAHNSHWNGRSGGNHTHYNCMVMSKSNWDNRHCNDPHIHLCESPIITSTTEVTLTQGYCHGNNSFHYSGHCYYLLNDIKRRHEHESCHHFGNNYQLAVIDNDQEQMAVVDFVRNTMNYTGVVWLRGFYVNDNDQHYWGWRHGDRMDLNSHLWKDDPHTHHRGCVVLDGNQWGIRYCGDQHYQLCEEI